MKPQKAKHFHLEAEKKAPHYVGRDYLVFEKHDGWYGYVDPGGLIHSRNMRAIPSLEWMASLFTKLKGRLIFEILVTGMPEFKDLNGYLNRKAEGPKAYLRVHDYLVPGNLTAKERFKVACDWVEAQCIPTIITMANYLGTYKSYEWQDLAEQQWAAGREGIVMKDVNSKYTPGSRIGSLLKIKEDMTLDMMVIDVVEGKGKYEGMLGALKVFESTGQEHLVGGMTDAERQLWWYKPGSIVGQVVEIKAMKRLANGSLREPRFKAVRHDKGIEDID